MLVAIVFALHLMIISTPSEPRIFDEAFYVPAAHCMINGTVCNVEHPPLAKALIAVSINTFGDNSIGWRLPNVIAGTLSLILVYLIVRKLGGDEKMALIATFLMSFENLWFVHSSVAMLDIIAHFFALLGVYVFLRGKLALAGLIIGVSMLAKEVTILTIPVLVLYEIFRQTQVLSRKTFKTALLVGIKMSVPAAIIFLAGLGVYDVAYNAFEGPFHHLARFKEHNDAIGSKKLGDADVHPLQWFTGFLPADYFVTSVKVGDKIMHYSVQYRSQPNLLILMLLWITIPIAFTNARKKNPLELLNFIFFVVVYIAMVAVSFSRITYPFYMVQIIPSICILNACFLSRLPKSVLIIYLIGVLASFVFWFPINVFVS